MLKRAKKIWKEDIQWFDVEYGIYLMSETRIWYLHECFALEDILKYSVPREK